MYVDEVTTYTIILQQIVLSAPDCVVSILKIKRIKEKLKVQKEEEKQKSYD